MTLLVRMGFPVLPVGIGERDRRLTLSIGPPFVPQVPADKARRDAEVAGQVMRAIGRLLEAG